MNSRFVSKVRSSLSRDGDLPLARRVEKGVKNGAALLTAPFHLRACNRIGARARTRGRPIVENLGTIEIGDDFQVNCAFSPVRLHVGAKAKLVIGESTSFNFGCSLSAAESITIGSRVSFGPYVTVTDHDASSGSKPERIEIGDDVWLAARVRVCKGVTIGNGTVVTAGSVVESSLPPGVIAGGSPARVLRLREPAAAAPVAAPPVEAPKAIEARGLVVADFTATDLKVAIERADPLGPSVDAEVAPFDQVVQTLHSLARGGADGDSPLDFAFVWSRPERVSPAFARALAGEAVPAESLLADVDAFAELVVRAKGARFLFVASWTMPPHHRGRGMIDLKEGGIARALARMNLRLAEKLDEVPNAFVLDASRWMRVSSAYHHRLWYLGKVGFSREVFAEAARDLRAALRGVRGSARKLLVLDLDDTLWGGILGDAGWQNLRLGGHDPVGEALVDFQRAILALTKRGIALAVVSKNEESVALEAIRSHPEMVIRQEHLAAWRINWRDKAANILELVTELNLGLQSVVFIDDNVIERTRVREALPEVFVPEWPADQTEYLKALESLVCFDAPRVSAEDAARTELYDQERQREQARQRFGSLDEWLDGLGTKVRFARLDASNLPRTTQLLNKTNQMNLRTRRMSEPELLAWASEGHRELWAIHVSDKLGDAGLTGILGLEVEGDALDVADYVLSCRVMGRRVEETLVWFALERARKRGLARARARYAKTAKNKPCLSFWESASGFARDGDVFERDVTRPLEAPRMVEVIVQDGDRS